MSAQDGHYLELCNCQLLTDFCFSRDATDLAHKTALHTYEEGVPTAACGGRTPTFSFFVAVRLVVKALQARFVCFFLPLFFHKF